MPGRRSIHSILAATLLLASVGLVGCASGASPSPGSIRAEGPWARPSMGMDRAGAAYLVLINGSGQDDALVGVTSPQAATVELHETVAGASGMMAMQPVARIELPKGARVELKPGGYHIMLIGLTQELKVGDTVELTLRFEHGPALVVQAPVRES